jgi:hypothetical protein
VASVGMRVDATRESKVSGLELYSFVPLHALPSGRLRRDTARFDGALVSQLREAKFDVSLVDVEKLIEAHGLPVDIQVTGSEGRHQSRFLPEHDVMVMHQSDEPAGSPSHRLVLMPIRMSRDRSTGVTRGIVQWRVETTDDATPIVIGLMRYTADVRGFPAKRMARHLVAELNKLGIR